MSAATERAQIKLHLRLLDEAYDKAAWYGPNLRGAIRGVTAAGAAWRPGPGRHNIWEIVLHVAYWKYVVWRRLRGGKRRAFAYKGRNWFARPAARSESAWRRDVALLAQLHRKLRETVAGLPETALDKRATGSKASNSVLIRAIACHDVYHAGQIQLLKRLQEKGTG